MGFFDDAQKFTESKQQQTKIPASDNILTLDTPEQEERLFEILRKLYENATRLEIERAVRSVADQMEKPYDKEMFMKKIRVKLED